MTYEQPALPGMELEELYDLKQTAARWSGSRYYGDGGTIHGSRVLDIEVDKDGRVASVWFRCQLLPFREFTRDNTCFENPNIGIAGIEIVDDEPSQD